MAGHKGWTVSAAALAALMTIPLSGVTTAQPTPQAPGSPPGSPPDPAAGSGPTVPTIPLPAVEPGRLQPSGSTGVPGSPGPVLGPAGLQPGGLPGAPPRFAFTIDPKTPTKDLLPPRPDVKPVAGPLLTDDLTKVPEVEFAARPANPANDPKRLENAAHQLAKINHLNARKTDAFMAELLESRDDLAGMPFEMGDACRTSPERARQFTLAVNAVRQALRAHHGVANVVFNFNGPGATGLPPGSGFGGQFGGIGQAQMGGVPAGGQNFWQTFATLCDQEDAARPKSDKDAAEHATVARVAALSQILAPDSAEMRAGLAKYLTGVPHVEATKALARLAIYSPEDDVRALAVTALKVRREKDYTDILVKGLRSPLPAVAKRAAEAITRIGRTDLIPELVAVLDEPDPRMPAARDVGGKKVAVVRELVKVNHHRNCAMCHQPGNPATVSGNVITAEVAVPGQPLPSMFEGYNRPQSSPDLMVRIDVTYLRQDFSATLPVADAAPWPEAQRFDFFVRERKLTDAEAAVYAEQLTPKEAGVVTPYHRAALAALRDITGKDAAPTADAWRALLKLPAKDKSAKTSGTAKVPD